MLCWVLAEQARHEHMSDEYKKQYLYYCSVAVIHILGLSDQHEIPTVVPSEPTKRGKVKRTNTDLPNKYRRSKLWKISCIMFSQNSRL